jgi:hypothetical protein
MWTIQGQQVRLKTNDVSGTLDLGVPGGGLQQLSCSEKTLPLVGLLGVSLPQQLIDASQANLHYTRDNCLVASYGDLTTTNCHAQLQWRCLDSQPSSWLAGLELVISFEAPILTRLPEWQTVSEISNQVILAPADSEAETWVPITDDAQTASSLEKHHYKMLLCRFPEQELSYVEMVHCQQTWLSVFSGTKDSDSETTAWGLQTPADQLEKGVILRRVLRGLFLPLDKDESLAREAYQQFATIAPPLN